MKKCEICQKEYDELLEKCPYCATKFGDYEERVNSTNESNENNKEIERNSSLDTSSEPQKKMFCKYCGSKIINNNVYCSHCGRNIYDKEKKHCTNCGKELENKQTFCDNCGQKVAAVVLPKKVSEVQHKINKKKIIIAAILFVALVGIVIAGVKLLPKLFVTYDAYMTEGNYEKAYDKARNDEKELVIKENIVAIVSGLTKESLKDSSSFVLREVYIDEDMKNVVLKEQGNNSYGGAVSGYVWYRWNEEDAEFESWGSCSDFETEEYNSWDDDDDKLDKLADNIVKKYIENFVSEKKQKMDSAVVDRINGLNKEGKLDDIKLIDEAKSILGKKDDKAES